MGPRSYWIPGAYALTVSEHLSAFIMSLKNKGFKDGWMAKVRADDLDKSTTLESNKSLGDLSEEDVNALPVDGAAQHDHYIYGLPKRPA
jgi:hypothetical protein